MVKWTLISEYKEGPRSDRRAVRSNASHKPLSVDGEAKLKALDGRASYQSFAHLLGQRTGLAEDHPRGEVR